jgi:hypothetical protein
MKKSEKYCTSMSRKERKLNDIKCSLKTRKGSKSIEDKNRNKVFAFLGKQIEKIKRYNGY